MSDLVSPKTEEMAGLVRASLSKRFQALRTLLSAVVTAGGLNNWQVDGYVEWDLWSEGRGWASSSV